MGFFVVGLVKRLFALAFCAVVLAGCATSLARVPVPRDLVDSAQISGLPPVRVWGDEIPADLPQRVAIVQKQLVATRPELRDRKKQARFTYLALSGGGGDGAYGAGFLNGWTKTGARPHFDIVTGVSTGALIAPFAFLGPRYDKQLEEVYTQYGTKDLVTSTPLISLISEGAASDNSKFAALIANYITDAFVAEIAAEYRKGRRLLVGTTNLDAQRPVIWDVTEIASFGGPSAVALIREVLLASAAIPGVFPPVLVNVEADGKLYKEMHVDGGTTSEVFFLPTQVNFNKFDRKIGKIPQRTLYIIWNGRLQPEWEPVKAGAIAVSRRSLSTLFKNQGIGDLSRIYVAARRNKIAYRLTSIPPSFHKKSKEPFDLAYMNDLYKTGLMVGSSGKSWVNKPPGL